MFLLVEMQAVDWALSPLTILCLKMNMTTLVISTLCKLVSLHFFCYYVQYDIFCSFCPLNLQKDISTVQHAF